MDAPLVQIVEERIAATAPPDADWPLLVLAACEGPDQLERTLGGAPVEAPRRLPTAKKPRAKRAASTQAGAEAQPAEPAEPLGAYLRSVTVEGFRGIGARQTLHLTPGPGLTLVVGRNGSGKSSFAEGLEILLTGENWRWAKRSRVWKEGWRNLHHRTRTEVQAEVAVEGENGATTITRTWPDGADLTGSQASVRLPSKGARTDLAALGWTQAMESHRPFLSYNELSAMFEGPTELHDRLSAVLGLGALEDAAKLLATARLDRERDLKASRAELVPLLGRWASGGWAVVGATRA